MYPALADVAVVGRPYGVGEFFFLEEDLYKKKLPDIQAAGF